MTAMGVARKALMGLLLPFSCVAGTAPWEPSFAVRGDLVVIRPPVAVKATRERVEILISENCAAIAGERRVGWTGDCEFLQAAYVATVRSGKGETLRVSFPFAVTARGSTHTLLLDAAEVVD
jgi:hypothetical protein